MRIVIDTNILISAGLKPGGLEARVLALVLTGELTAVATEWTWAEYVSVLRRKKFAEMRHWAEALLAGLEQRVEWCVAHERLAVAEDEDDNRFLECAVAGGAGILLTGNGRHYPREFGGVKVMNAREFLATIN